MALIGIVAFFGLTPEPGALAQLLLPLDWLFYPSGALLLPMSFSTPSDRLQSGVRKAFAGRYPPAMLFWACLGVLV